jgi:hypothetical protein
MSFVVATMIHADGETDTLFLEPADAISGGCVALTGPMPEDEAERVLAEIQAERNRDNPHPWLRAEDY